MVYTTQSAKETKKLAGKFAQSLKPGDTVALSGTLGSGKTTFIQGLAESLGVKTRVNSPTFFVMKSYGKLVHADLYRVKSLEDLISTGFFDWLGSPDQIVVIEWPQLITQKLPKATKRIHFKIIDETKREITVD